MDEQTENKKDLEELGMSTEISVKVHKQEKDDETDKIKRYITWWVVASVLMGAIITSFIMFPLGHLIGVGFKNIGQFSVYVWEITPVIIQQILMFLSLTVAYGFLSGFLILIVIGVFLYVFEEV